MKPSPDVSIVQLQMHNANTLLLPKWHHQANMIHQAWLEALHSATPMRPMGRLQYPLPPQ